MKIKEIRKKSKEDVLKMLKEKQKRLYDIRFASAESDSKNVKEVANLRKDIARIKTILNEGI